MLLAMDKQMQGSPFYLDRQQINTCQKCYPASLALEMCKNAVTKVGTEPEQQVPSLRNVCACLASKCCPS